MLLPEHCICTWWPSLGGAQQGSGCWLEEEHDDDLQWLQQAVNNDQLPEPLWKSYRDWLRLMLTHFDAVEILANSVTSPQFSSKAIDMKILVMPNVDMKMLSWRDLFVEQVFPKHSMGDKLTTNKNLLKFLSEVISSKPGKAAIFVKDLKMHFEKIATINDKTEIEIASFMCLKLWPGHQLPGWKQSRAAPVENFRGLQECSEPADFQSYISSINEKFDLLLDTVKFPVASNRQTSQGWWTSSRVHCWLHDLTLCHWVEIGAYWP